MCDDRLGRLFVWTIKNTEWETERERERDSDMHPVQGRQTHAAVLDERQQTCGQGPTFWQTEHTEGHFHGPTVSRPFQYYFVDQV